MRISVKYYSVLAALRGPDFVEGAEDLLVAVHDLKLQTTARLRHAVLERKSPLRCTLAVNESLLPGYDDLEDFAHALRAPEHFANHLKRAVLTLYFNRNKLVPVRVRVFLRAAYVAAYASAANCDAQNKCIEIFRKAEIDAGDETIPADFWWT